jgi:branched-chain amino acid transport system substrate-binding protein
MKMKKTFGFGAVAVLAALLAGPAQAEIKVGFITSLSGPGASIGIPYSKGMKAALAYMSEVTGEKIRVIELDDASDTSAAARNARKLIDEEKVDVLMGTSGVPGSLAMVSAATELKVPMIGVTPLPPGPAGEGGPWVISIPQTPKMMVAAVVEHMKKQKLHNIAFIGFSDSWGDLVYDGLTSSGGSDIKVVANERYARPDTSVTGQVLKIVAAKPDAVMNGGSGTPGALPFLALAERGYKGPTYGSHALINADFVRVGAASVEGVICPTGPVVVAEQLADSAPTKKMALAFRAAYEKANGATTTDAFSPYVFDGWLVLLDAARRALAKGAKPGTPEFRAALREAIVNTKDVVGAHAVYNFTPADRSGVDDRARVLVQLQKGAWKLMP